MKTLVAFLLFATSAYAAGPDVHRDLPYAGTKNERQTLDVYAPTEGKDHPVVFWIHGGGWQTGKKTEVQTKPQAFVDREFVFVSTEYRLLPEVTIGQMGREGDRWHHVRKAGPETEAVRFSPNVTHSVVVNREAEGVKVYDNSLPRGIFVVEPETVVATAAAMSGSVRVDRGNGRTLLGDGLRGVEDDEFHVGFRRH